MGVDHLRVDHLKPLRSEGFYTNLVMSGTDSLIDVVFDQLIEIAEQDLLHVETQGQQAVHEPRHGNSGAV